MNEIRILKPLIKPAITKEQLNAYAKASRDHNPIHLDDEIAKKNGLPGVIAHGMITMAFMGEFLHSAIENVKILEISCRFRAMTFPGDVITISGTAKPSISNAAQYECSIETKNQKGEITSTGTALIHDIK